MEYESELYSVASVENIDHLFCRGEKNDKTRPFKFN